ncbi:MAG: glycosyltransferase family 2 protein [Flavobacteriales bacterium]|nr:glycosyltransferase family 2 protein [Flavobacteriales bacterium]
MKETSNDYSDIADLFEKNSGYQLLSKDRFSGTPTLSISIVIPCFNSKNTLCYTLDSIKRQSYIKKGGDIEVIVVDDASPEALYHSVRNYEEALDVKYLRLPKNVGAGKAREIGAGISTKDILCFVDSDIVLIDSFLENHEFVHQYVKPPVILISFRENVYQSQLSTTANRVPNSSNGDHRIYMRFKDDWVIKEEDKALVGQEFRLLEQSDFFKSFGHFRKIGEWTLPQMVLTCAMSFNRNWGARHVRVPQQLVNCTFDDTCIAAKMIADGAQVIPLLNSDVYHYLEPSHTRTDEMKKQDFLRNEVVYKQVLDSSIDEN